MSALEGGQKDIIKMIEGLRYYFDAAVESIHADFAGANKDEISMLQTKSENLDGRLQKVESRVEV